eukprot:TRINITY_DN78009_c0_g1_i1.p1 TRINITY_DN78009_c0_g1~~TRINITY_DN78009_c0_g1_i1.p1  ORF type:complete len:254 (+),score=54.73 TRINITY_DN78009_c0_g1_i1:627-1388(+)
MEAAQQMIIDTVTGKKASTYDEMTAALQSVWLVVLDLEESMIIVHVIFEHGQHFFDGALEKRLLACMPDIERVLTVEQAFTSVAALQESDVYKTCSDRPQGTFDHIVDVLGDMQNNVSLGCDLLNGKHAGKRFLRTFTASNPLQERRKHTCLHGGPRNPCEETKKEDASAGHQQCHLCGFGHISDPQLDVKHDSRRASRTWVQQVCKQAAMFDDAAPSSSASSSGAVARVSKQVEVSQEKCFNKSEVLSYFCV